jgi:hypothetical protein
MSASGQELLFLLHSELSQDLRLEIVTEPLHGNARAALSVRPAVGPTAVRDCHKQDIWSSAMQNMTTIEAKAFVPSKDFALSKRFYQDFGFDLAWSSESLAYFSHGNSSFLLQDFYEKAHAENFKMHLLVEDVEAWWNHVKDQGLEARYGVRIEPPSDKPWGIRDFALSDPTGVAWRIGQNIDEASEEIA